MMAAGETEVYIPLAMDVEALAAKASSRYQELYPEVFENYSDYTKARTRDDFRNHVMYMRESLAVDAPEIFLDYVIWAQILHTSSYLPRDFLAKSLVAFRDVLEKELPPEDGAKAGGYIGKALDLLVHDPPEIPSFIRNDNPLATPARAYLSALSATNREGARVIIMDLVEKNVPIRDIYRHIFEPALRETGRLWQMQKASVAEEHYITEVTRLFIALLYNRMVDESRKKKRKGRSLVAACVSEELHDVGIRMVADFLEMDGWDTVYVGANTPASSIVSLIRDRHADAVAISSTMSFHIPKVHEMIRAIRADPDTAGTRIIIGGYPFTIVPDLWKRLGADGCAHSADEAVEVANRLVAS